MIRIMFVINCVEDAFRMEGVGQIEHRRCDFFMHAVLRGMLPERRAGKND